MSKNFRHTTCYRLHITVADPHLRTIVYSPNGSLELSGSYPDNPFKTESAARKHLSRLLKERHDEIREYRLVKYDTIILEEVIDAGMIVEKKSPAESERLCRHCGDPVPNIYREFCSVECQDCYEDTID